MNRSNGSLWKPAAILYLIGLGVWFVWWSALSAAPVPDQPQEMSGVQDRVAMIFEKNCISAGCHSGSYPQQGLKLTPESFYGTTVNVQSAENPALKRVNPGNPDSSYLVMKIMGDPGITGLRMPFGREPLKPDEIAAIVEWIKDLKIQSAGIATATQAAPLLPFSGWKVVNIPTTRMVDAGNWLFLIEHRFFPKINDGYNAFWGLDGPANIFLNLGYAFTDNLFVNLGRSNISADVELDVRYGLKRQYPGDKLPFAAAAQISGNWDSQKVAGKNRWRSEALKLAAQVMLSHQVTEGVAAIITPGILFNPNSDISGEDPMITIGLGGKAHFYKSLSLIGEWVPIVSGYTLTSIRGQYNRFDTWGGGLEIYVGGHVFQIVVTNSVGTTTDQYLRGGDLRLQDGDMRLGFNIFRILQF